MTPRRLDDRLVSETRDIADPKIRKARIEMMTMQGPKFRFETFALLLAIGCSGHKGSEEPASRFAEVGFRDIPPVAYQQLRARLTPTGGETLEFLLPSGTAAIDSTLEPGRYRAELDLISTSGDVAYGSSYCSGTFAASQDVYLAPGPNELKIFLCERGSGVAINDAGLEIAALTVTSVPTDGTVVGDHLDESRLRAYFSFEAVSGREYLISVGGSGIDTTKSLYRVEQGRLGARVGFNDDSNGLNPALRFAAPEGGTYVFSVDGFDDREFGNFTVSIKETP